MYCSNCGAQSSPGASFCSRCGAPLTAGAVAPAVPFTAPTSPGPPPPVSVVASGAAVRADVRYAGFWRRFLAAVIDAVLVAIAGGLIDVAMGVSIIEPDYTQGNTWMATCLRFLLSWIYCAWFESSRMQGTLGQQSIAIMVTDLQGRRISFARATGRYFGQIPSLLLLGIGFLMIAFTEKKQGLHDLMAGCLVVRRPEESKAPS